MKPTYRWRVVCLRCADGTAKEGTFSTASAAYAFAERVAPAGLDPERFVKRQAWDGAAWIAAPVGGKRIASFAG